MDDAKIDRPKGLPTGLHARQGSNASSIGDDGAWTGFAGAVPVEGEAEGEERMSVSAALQRFRRMERLSKEQRALAEQQQAVLDAQRQQALTHRHSGAGGSGTGSPSGRAPQPLNMADWLGRVSIVKESIPYPSAQRLAVEAQHPQIPAPISPTGNVWRRTSLESQGSGDGGTGSHYRRSFSASSSTGGSAIVRGPHLSDATVRAAMSSDSVQAAISAASSSPDSPKLLASAIASPAGSPLLGSPLRSSSEALSPDAPTRLSVQISPHTPEPLGVLDEPDVGDSSAAANGPGDVAAGSGGAEAAPQDASPAEAEAATPDEASIAAAAAEMHAAAMASAESGGSDGFGDFADAQQGAAAAADQAAPPEQPAPVAAEAPEAACEPAAPEEAPTAASAPAADAPAAVPAEAPAAEAPAAAAPADAPADESDDDFGDFDQAEAVPSPPAEPKAAAQQPAAPVALPAKLAPPAATPRTQPLAAPASPPPPPLVQLPKSEALVAAQAAAANKGGTTGSILDLENSEFEAAVAAILAEDLGSTQQGSEPFADVTALLTLADLQGQQPATDAPSERVAPIPWRSSQAEERLLKQLGLQQAAADAAAKQRASVSGMSTRRRSSSIAAQRATAHEAAAVQRTGSAGPPGAVERSGSASDFGSFTDGGRPAGGGRAGDPFAASGELGFEFVDPPAGFDVGAAASDYVKVQPRPALPKGPPKPPPVFRSLAGDGKAAPKRRLSKFGTPDVEQPTAPQAKLAPPPPSSRAQGLDPLRQVRSAAPQAAATADPFAAMGQHDLTPATWAAPTAPQQAVAAADTGDDDDDFDTFQSAEEVQAAADAKAAADAADAALATPADGTLAEPASAEPQAASEGSTAAGRVDMEGAQHKPDGSGGGAAAVPAEAQAEAAVSGAPAARHAASNSPGGLQELVPQEADESWLSAEPAASESAAARPTAAEAVGAAEAVPAGDPAAEALGNRMYLKAAAPQPAVEAAGGLQPVDAAPAAADEDGDDDDFVWSAAEPVAPSPGPAAAPEPAAPPQPPAQQPQQQVPSVQAVPQHPTGVPRGFALSLPKPPPGRRSRDAFGAVGAAPASGGGAPAVDIFVAQQPLFSAPPEEPAPQSASSAAASAAPEAQSPAMEVDSNDDFGRFAGADANGVAAASPPLAAEASGAEPAEPPAAEQPVSSLPTADAEEDDEFGDFEASEAMEPPTAGAAANEAIQQQAHLSEEGQEPKPAKEPEPAKDPFADLF